MSQASRILSQEQRSALELAFTTLKGVSAFLQSIESRLTRPDERLQAINTADMADLAQRKLLEAFPELHGWLEEWLRGGLKCG